MQPGSNEHTPTVTPQTATTDEEEEQNEQVRDLESLSNSAAGTVIATVQQEPTSEDDADDESDPGVGEEIESTTTSLLSSAEEYVTKNGRRYQNPMTWFLPNDQCEQDRMDLRHEISTMTLGERLLVSQDRLSSAPRVLDVGTGTGLWAIDIADEYSRGGEVVGIDLSPIQPRWVPPNCHFLVDDAEKTWDDSKKYNLVHLRYMEGAFTDWPWIFEQAMTVLEPGGIIEVHGLDFRPYAQEGKVPEEILTWIAQLYDFTEERGRPMDVIGGYQTWMKEAGFEDVQKHEFVQPLGPWPKDKKYKEIGILNLEATLNGIEAYTLEPFREGGWSLQETTLLIALVRHAYQKNWFGNQLHTKLVVVTARKPGGAK